MSLGSRVIGLIGTLVIARFLVPAEYGEVTAAAIVTITAFGVTTLGIGIYLISNRDLTRVEAFHATCWFLATGAAALGLVWAASPLLGDWLEAPALGDYMPLFVASAMLDRVAYLPERMLIRKLRFRWVSIVRAVGELAFTATSLVLARLGYGAMSIVWGYFVRSALRFVAIVPAVDWREWIEPHRLRGALLVKIIRSGVIVSVAGIATFLQRRCDNLIISAFFGNAVMGAYNYAYNLADTPAVAIGEQVSDVVAASFPHAEGAKRQAALVRACTMISLIMFPLAFGLGAVSDTVVEAFFNAQWSSIGTLLALLAALSAPRPIAHILHAYLFAGQRMRVVLWTEWVSLAVLMAAVAGFAILGIHWACAAVGLVFVGRTLLLLWVVHRLDGIPMGSFLVPLIRPLAVCLAMAAAILAVRPALSELLPAVRLLVEVGLGAVIYLLGAAVVFRRSAGELIGMVRSAISRRG